MPKLKRLNEKAFLDGTCGRQGNTVEEELVKDT